MRAVSLPIPSPSAPHTRRRAAPALIALAAALLGTQTIAPAAADCIDDAANYQRVHPQVLRAIAYHESRMRPQTVNYNKNRTTDIGLMGINTVHNNELSRHGIDQERLFDPCVNAYVGAWLLRRKVDRYGQTWKAVAAYHSETPEVGEAYMRRIQEVMRRWGLLPAMAAGNKPAAIAAPVSTPAAPVSVPSSAPATAAEATAASAASAALTMSAAKAASSSASAVSAAASEDPNAQAAALATIR
ncbi:lytic transglycosylase domain-containing protein [Lysobacter gummosus]|uniref:Lytic transglycosylase domain-containing protein n=1 Tax=Lysobacter gummosus TaxID=262324 RepID=A0ABY3XCL1_9GAMM|nr:lytic transglycosylase domain-containing protein [Lysobacter gummosus]ALN93539.1 transglycosylase SLT domain protein [Lysobacter gummosus]UNP28987.1 lytic transglycosylase domain-containing protein [Lysobacter gummosus]